jgi:hypothetical protein
LNTQFQFLAINNKKIPAFAGMTVAGASVIPDEAKRKSGIYVLIGVLTNIINNTPF